MEVLMTVLTTGRRTLRIWQVVEKVGLSKATIWRLSASGNFPKPIKISRGCTGWLEHEIDELLEARAAARVCKIGSSTPSEVVRDFENGGST
jgi:prophage regulatory protein